MTARRVYATDLGPPCSCGAHGLWLYTLERNVLTSKCASCHRVEIFSNAPDMDTARACREYHATHAPCDTVEAPL